jgi:hypothetical protein
MMLVTIGTAIMIPTYRYNSGRLGHGTPAQLPLGPNNALSNTSTIISGLITPRPEVTAIINPTSPTLPL